MTARTIKVAEMFAGVGGFRLALDGYNSATSPDLNKKPAGPFKTIWANQWEPPGTQSKQFAWRCYESRFGEGSCINEDINRVLDDFESGICDIPDFDMLVGGFPCQDYSVAKPLKLSKGMEGKKGVLWWDIYRMLRLKKPKVLMLENVDRLLKSPTNQRGRDFAVILSCLYSLGYQVEWRVINAADYGMPQKRRRVYMVGTLVNFSSSSEEAILSAGILAQSFPVLGEMQNEAQLEISADVYEVSKKFGLGLRTSPFQNSGFMQNGKVFTAKTFPDYEGKKQVLGDFLTNDQDVSIEYFVMSEDIPKWEYQRSAKRTERTTSDGFTYVYSEGSMPWPDPVDEPARTILTGEGGKSPSRMKHAVRGNSGKIRRLIPDELDQLQMFPKGWTNTGMTDGQRAFCMGNALVVGIPHLIGMQIAKNRKLLGV